MVYILGIPAFFYTVLRLNRDALHDPTHPDHKSVTARFGFLFSAYKPEAWWWEIVLLSQKLLLTGLIIFIKPDTASQLAAAFLISMTFLVLHVCYKPFADSKEEDLCFVSNLSITLTLFCGLLLKLDVSEEVYTPASHCSPTLSHCGVA